MNGSANVFYRVCSIWMTGPRRGFSEGADCGKCLYCSVDLLGVGFVECIKETDLSSHVPSNA